ncbi:MAG TPA: histidine kinase [Bryobacteraceae bacterium]|nr:histidine kinase [Bryobacteraceae bacterium]
MNESVLVNSLGHCAGVLIFSIFLFLLIQDRAARRLRGNAKSMLAAALALMWNLASLAVLGMGSRDIGEAPAAAAFAFSVLSLLPAVLFDLSLNGRLRALARAAYLLSAVAIALHIAELLQPGETYHKLALWLITAGFGILTCVAALRPAAESPRLVGTMSLFLLAISFVHFGGGHAQQIWSRELAFHHAAIPLALLVLLQDYRFVLLDAFLRFLANVLLASLFVAPIAAAWRLDWFPRASTPFEQALLAAGACLLLIAFALARRRVQALLTRLAFGRPDHEALLSDLKSPVRDEDAYIQSAVQQLGQFMGAAASVAGDSRLDALDLRRPTLVSELTDSSGARAELESQGVETVIPLRAGLNPTRYALLGRRFGGRRYLSEDLTALARAASVIVGQIEAHRESEMRRLVAQAELRALQSQIHPHFLFNALNALYGVIPREAKGAREAVLNLAGIFRYFLETRKAFLPLREELRIVTAYLEVERLRLGEKLRTEVDVAPEALAELIPVLSIQPLVENAVKHGIAPFPEGGLVRIEVRRHASGALAITVLDTGAGFSPKARTNGVGIENVARRLELSYGHSTRLEVNSGPGGTSVSFSIPAAAAAGAA